MVALGISPISPVTTSIGAAFGNSTSQGESRIELPTDATLEQRVARLEENAEAPRQRIRAAGVALADEQRQRVAAIESEQRLREAEVNRIRELIRSLSLGGVDISLLGVFWLAFGVVFATIPGPLAALILPAA